MSFSRRLAAEAAGTALLLAAVVGSGIMGERLAGGNIAIALLANSVATGAAQWWSEAVATFGLIAVIIGCTRGSGRAVPYAVGAYIMAAYWFTASTSFANPAVTLARAASATFAGLRPQDALPFIVAQLAGAIAAGIVMRWLLAGSTSSDDRARR